MYTISVLESLKGDILKGQMKVKYKIICKGDINQEISLEELLQNEKVFKAIKSAYSSGKKDIVISAMGEASIKMEAKKEIFEFIVEKNDFADLLELAEEDARKHKRLKGVCQQIELVDIETI